MNIDRENLVLFHDYTSGHAQDLLSPYGNHGTLTGGGGFRKGKRGWVYLPANGNCCVEVADSPSIDLLSATFAFSLDMLKPFGNIEFLFDRRIGADLNYLCYWLNSTVLHLYVNGALTQFIIASTSVYVGVKTLEITIPTGPARAKLYFDGIFYIDSDVDVTMVPSNHTLRIGQAATFTANQQLRSANLNACLIYNVAKSADQVAAIHESLLSLHTPHTGSRRTYSTPSVHANQTGLRAGWNMEKKNGKIIDVKGVNNGTTSGVVLQKRTPWGEACLDLQGGSIDCGSDSSLDFTTEIFGGMMWGNQKEVETNLILRGTYPNTGYRLFFSGGNFYFAGCNAGATLASAPTNAFALNKDYLYSFLIVPSVGMYVFRNGVDVTQAPTPGNIIASAAANFMINSWGKNTLAALKMFTASSYAEALAAIKAEYNRVASMCLLHIDFDSSPTGKVWSAGQTIDGTPIEVVSGTWQVVWDSTLYKKVLECVTAGDIAIKVPQGNPAYGTWRFQALKKDASNFLVMPISSVKGQFIASGQNGYMFYPHVTEALALSIVTGGAEGASLFVSAGSYVSPDTWYDYKLTRTTEGVFTVYANNNLVPAAGGSNPCTNTTHTSSKYWNFDLDAGDRIADIDKLFGVPIS